MIDINVPPLRSYLPPLLLVLLVFAAACSLYFDGPQATIGSPGNTRTPVVAHAATQIISEAEATGDARATAMLEATQRAATGTAEGLEAEKTATAEALTLATAQAQTMFDRIQALHSNGTLSTRDGSFYALPNFEASWAQINYYDFLLTGRAPPDFVLRVDAAWESSSAQANLWNSGCGLIFRMNARGDHYLVLFGADGWVYFYRKLDGALTRLDRHPYSDMPLPAGNAEFLLVVDGNELIVFVDDGQITRFQDSHLKSGFLGYALASGSNRDFGTRCRMENVELWELNVP